ncbi:hypothetical protein JOB18_044884 [Solea senegalensis]|uniref:Uncharacterized protein n=1 Tax=Solea senegalensis TaxID=28829 RepID=A0AAV6QAR0_SOLSE|nr:hypothetical protein JOB18_044884 [Solea senegalensis]
MGTLGIGGDVGNSVTSLFFNCAEGVRDDDAVKVHERQYDSLSLCGNSRRFSYNGISERGTECKCVM